jgi:beta-1,3-galactosyltransferase 1
VKVVFLLGISDYVNNEIEFKVIQENEMYGDIIQENFVENYNNLTLKTIFTFKWVVSYCDEKGNASIYCLGY